MSERQSPRRALVLASTDGLGRACAESLALDGHRLVICGRREAVAVELASQLGDAMGLMCDLASTAAIDALVERTIAALDGVDILVLNAGGPPAADASAAGAAEYQQALDEILFSAVRLINAFVPGMRERGWGRVIAIGSSGIEQPIPGLAASNVARAALAALLKTLAFEVARDGVTVNVVIPGRFATSRVERLDAMRAQMENLEPEEVRRRSQAGIPARRYGRPKELGDVVAFLSSDAASYVTGSFVRVDGGLISSTH